MNEFGWLLNDIYIYVPKDEVNFGERRRIQFVKNEIQC